MERVDRRTFLSGGAFAAVAVARGFATDAPRLVTFSDWLRASPQARAAALEPLADRIRTEDQPIHAWVQVRPQQGGAGTLSGILLQAAVRVDQMLRPAS